MTASNDMNKVDHEWREMLRNLHQDKVHDNTTTDVDGTKRVDIEIKMVHDERRVKWQRILLDAIDDDAVLNAVWEFFYERLQDKVRRHEDGEPWTDDKGGVLVFEHDSDELKAAADRAIVLGMTEVIRKLMKRMDKKHGLTEKGWFKHIDRSQMHSVLYEILLSNYVIPNPDL